MLLTLLSQYSMGSCNIIPRSSTVQSQKLLKEKRVADHNLKVKGKYWETQRVSMGLSPGTQDGRSISAGINLGGNTK